MRGLVAPVVPRGVTYQVGFGDASVGVIAGVAILLIFATSSAAIAARRTSQAGAPTGGAHDGRPICHAFQNALIAIQVALSVVLAIATTVVGLSLVKVAGIDLGLDVRGMVTSILYLPSDASWSARARAAQRTVSDELRRLDGALSVAFSDTPPFAGGSNSRMALDDGRPVVPGRYRQPSGRSHQTTSRCCASHFAMVGRLRNIREAMSKRPSRAPALPGSLERKTVSSDAWFT